MRQARHTAYKQQREVQTSDLRSDIALREVAAILRSDLSLIISETEYQLLQDSFGVPQSLLLRLPFMLEQPKQSLPTFEERTDFLTIGNFRHAPNWDAVLWLKEQIWPRIRKQMPGAQLQVYGAYPPPKATALHNAKEGFNVLGWVDDANQVMRQARVCLAPLRFGAGIKGKLAEAMLNGTPNVTTSIGAEAMSGGLDWSGSVQDDPQALADAAVELHQNQNLWHRCQANGFNIIETGYNKTHHSQRLLDAIHHQLANLEALRLSNFTGAMLRHHHHKSTQYMAQWIEAKNRNNLG